jgi:ATP-dependent RNA helicase DHX8/PRP22
MKEEAFTDNSQISYNTKERCYNVVIEKHCGPEPRAIGLSLSTRELNQEKVMFDVNLIFQFDYRYEILFGHVANIEQNMAQLFPAHVAQKRRRSRSNSADFVEAEVSALATGRALSTIQPTPSSITSKLSKGDVKSLESEDLVQLPVHAFKKEIMAAVLQGRNKIVFILAETGSGKSTQIPAYFLSSNATELPSNSAVFPFTRMMAVTQPRRVAAMTLAQRVSSEQAQPMLIGYRVRFQDTTGPTTQLVYITDGMLLREAMVDPLLQQYSIVFLDEAHERSLQTDILMGIVKKAHRERFDKKNPLHVVVMSATMQLQPLIQYFGGDDAVTLIQVPGRQYPVQILYTAQTQDDYVESSLAVILQIHDSEVSTAEKEDAHLNGDILVFLPGQEDIESLSVLLKQHLSIRDEEALSSSKKASLWTGDRVEVWNSHRSPYSDDLGNSTHAILVAGVMICVLYAALPAELQLNAFTKKPPGCIRKVILATNIAETSVTIPAIRYVIDTGKYKCRFVTSSTGMECLNIFNISQAQAAQRAGRAGRVQAGLCFRLYTEDAYGTLAATSIPEILRVNLAQVVLQLKGMGIEDPTTFEFVTPPDQQSLVRAMKLLYALSALDDDMTLTEYGKKLAKLPLDPVYGHLLLRSAEHGCMKEMLTVVSVLSADNLLYTPSGEGLASSKATTAHRRFISHEGDIPTYLNVYAAWEREATFFGTSMNARKAEKRMHRQERNSDGGNKLQSHGDWCQQNSLSGRALARAFDVRIQLQNLCRRPVAQNGLGLDVTTSCGEDRERFLKCVAAGLFLQAASRIKTDVDVNKGKGRSGQITSSRGRYRTKVGNETVSVHPTSSMFNRQPAPNCVVYTELVVTKKSYIRGVTQIREEWLNEVAPTFYSET